MFNTEASAIGCTGLFAYGVGEVRDVDLRISTPEGQALDEDGSPLMYAYSRVCAAPGVPLVASVTMPAGQGEVRVFQLERAPRDLKRPPADLFDAAAVPAGRLEPLRDVGAGSTGLDPLAPLHADEHRLSALGYAAVGAPFVLELPAGRGDTLLPLVEGHCYRVVVRVPGVNGVSATLIASSGATEAIQSLSDDALELPVCVVEPGGLLLRVMARAARAFSVVRAFEHETAKPKPGESSRMIVGAAEIREVMKSSGFVAHKLADGLAEPEQPLELDFEASAGTCFAASAVLALAPLGLELRLRDETGTVVARDDSRSRLPVVYHCPQQAGRYRLAVRTRGRASPVSVWLGFPRPAGKGVTP